MNKLTMAGWHIHNLYLIKCGSGMEHNLSTMERCLTKDKLCKNKANALANFFT